MSRPWPLAHSAPAPRRAGPERGILHARRVRCKRSSVAAPGATRCGSENAPGGRLTASPHERLRSRVSHSALAPGGICAAVRDCTTAPPLSNRSTGQR
eukprot:scaffold2329_cov34-Phaeocystis_antarctica.AAC.2